MNILSNTTVLSNFASIGYIKLLQKLFGTLYVPMEVYAEICDGLEEGYFFYEAVIQQIHPIIDNGWILCCCGKTEPNDGVGRKRREIASTNRKRG